MFIPWTKCFGFAVCLVILASVPVLAQPPDLTYHTVAPCVLVDTRSTGGAFSANETRTYAVAGVCGVPGFSNGIAQAQAVALTITAITPSGNGHIKAYAADQTSTLSVVNFTTGVNVANTTPVALAQTSGFGGDIKINVAQSSAHVLLSIVGYYSKAMQTVYVHPVPGDDTASGTRLLAALAAITDASATKHYVLKIEPGIYDLGSTMLVMQPYVDIEGSGQEATVIKGLGNFDSELHKAIIFGADSAELRDLQVYSDGSSYARAFGIAILNDGHLGLPAPSPKIKNVKIVSTKSQRSWGIRNEGASPSIEDVRIEVEASERAYGIVNSLDGYNPSIQRVTIEASGASEQIFGIANFAGSNPKMRDLQIKVTGGTGSRVNGIYDSSSTTNPVRLTNTTIDVAGGSTIRGIHSDGATVEVEQSQIRASGTGSQGIYSAGLVQVDHSLIVSLAATVAASTARIGATRLEGGSVSATTATCAGVYDASLTFYASACP
jgi:hypothetical protein